MIHNPWSIIRQYYLIDRLLDLFGPSRPPVQTQVDILRSMTEGDLRNARERLRVLEARSDTMDAYYLKVVGSALKQHVNQRMDIQDTKLANLEAKSFKGFVDLERQYQLTREALASNSAELAKTNSRISQILANLRKLGESNS